MEEAESQRRQRPSHEHRNERFDDSRAPFDENPSFNLLGATGSIRWFNPTCARYSHQEDTRVSVVSALIPKKLKRAVGVPVPPDADDNNDDDGDDHDNKQRDRRRSSSATTATTHSQQQAPTKTDDKYTFLWRSRDNRKGRHTLLVRGDGSDGDKEATEGGSEHYDQPTPTNTLPGALRIARKMVTKFPYWDISFMVAFIFTLGSVVWVINGFLTWLPLARPDLKFPDNLDYWVGGTAFAGGTIFLIGSILLLLEAVNANKTGCFGWAIQRVVKNGHTQVRARPAQCEHRHHHQHREENEDGDDDDDDDARSGQKSTTDYGSCPLGDDDDDAANMGETDSLLAAYNAGYTWRWFPSWYDLRSHYLHEIGFLACFIQLCACVVFWLSKFMALPQISAELSDTVLDGTYWMPQVVGGVGFMVSSGLIMLETQPRWYLPAPAVLGWHVGFWKLLGSLGFTLCAIFGPFGQHGDQNAEFQSALASFWGSWVILLGSIIQWFESLDKHPVVEEGFHTYSEWRGDTNKETR